MAEIPSIAWIHVAFVISVFIRLPQYFAKWSLLTESRKHKVVNLKPEKKFAICCFGHLRLGILQEVWLLKCLVLAPWKPSESMGDLHTHRYTQSHHCWAHEHLPEKLPRNMQWTCTSPTRCKWLQVLFCFLPSLMEKQQRKGDDQTADKNPKMLWSTLWLQCGKVLY